MSEWIACDDRMPEQGVRVLVWAPEHHADESILTGTFWNGRTTFNWDDRSWRLSNGDLINLCENSNAVTHWMPLPEAPI